MISHENQIPSFSTQPSTLLEGTLLHHCSTPEEPGFCTEEPSSAVTQTACERAVKIKKEKKTQDKSVTEVN